MPTLPDLHATLTTRVRDALAAMVPDLSPELLARVEITPAREAAHGDMATSAALTVAREARRPPPALAAELAAALRAAPEIEAAEPAGPGFVNLRLRAAAIRAVLPDILRAGESYGDSRHGAGIVANVEYVSVNPTGPLHVGHARGAVVGDALANLLIKTGHAVTKEYYVNDAGGQIVMLAWAAYWRYLQALGTALTEDAFATSVPGGLQYRGDYLIPVGEALAAEHGTALAGPELTIADPALWLDPVGARAVSMMMAEARADLAALGVNQDVFFSERALLASGAVNRAIDDFLARDLIYRGVLEPPKGKPAEDWEPREQLLFRATDHGDDVDRPLRKSDGSNTYFANDIAYHADKIARGGRLLVDVWGADHGGYVRRMRAAMHALDAAVGFEIILCQIVHVLRAGEPVRMSKRAGNFITLREVVEEVGPGAVRFTMLTRKPDAQMEFDLAAVVAQTRDNPVFYVQYAHARCRSVLRAAVEMLGADAVSPASLALAPLEPLDHPAERAVMLRLAAWPRAVEAASRAREPHRIAFFLYDLASDFHALWNQGRENTVLRFLQADAPEPTRARLALVEATATVIRSGLAVLGVAPVEEMR